MFRLNFQLWLLSDYITSEVMFIERQREFSTSRSILKFIWNTFDTSILPRHPSLSKKLYSIPTVNQSSAKRLLHTLLNFRPCLLHLFILLLIHSVRHVCMYALSHENATSTYCSSLFKPPLISLQKVQLLIINCTPPMLPNQYHRFHRIHTRKFNQSNRH